MCSLQMCYCHNSLSWLQKRSCPFLPFSKQETFPDSVFIHEFNAGSLQSGVDRLYGLLGNQSSLFSKSTTVDRPNLGALIQLELAFYRVRISQTRLPRCAIGKNMNAICAVTLRPAQRSPSGFFLILAAERVFAALHVYLSAIIADTAHNVPGGTLDRRYLDNLFRDLSADALAVIRNAAEEMREHENWRAS